MGTIKQNRANFIATAGKLDATGLNNDVPASNITNASMTSVTNFPPSLGTGIKQVSSDPPSPTTGQVWFNTTTRVLKQYVGVSAWSSGGNLPQALYENAGAGATITASLNFGGQGTPPGPAHPHSADTQTYNGTSWTEVNNLNNSRRLLGGAGTQTSALAFGGYTVPPAGNTQAYTESWDGSSWTEVNDLNTKRNYLQGIGISNTAALCGGGANPSTSLVAVTESWNGTSWTEVNDLNTARGRFGATGTSTAGLISSGLNPSSDHLSITESWDGSSWTEVGDLNTARNTTGGSGTYTSGLMSGGNTSPGLTAATEEYNGTSWSEVNDLNTARYIHGSSGDTTTSSLVFGGYDGSAKSVATEEFALSAVTQTITTS